MIYSQALKPMVSLPQLIAGGTCKQPDIKQQKASECKMEVRLRSPTHTSNRL